MATTRTSRTSRTRRWKVPLSQPRRERGPGAGDLRRRAVRTLAGAADGADGGEAAGRRAGVRRAGGRACRAGGAARVRAGGGRGRDAGGARRASPLSERLLWRRPGALISARATRLVSGRDAHGVEVGVVVEVDGGGRSGRGGARPRRCRPRPPRRRGGCRRGCSGCGRHRRGGEGHVERDVGQFDDAGRPDHVELSWWRPPRSGTASRAGHGQLVLAVGALLERELVLERRRAGPGRWPAGPAPPRRPAGRHHDGDGHDGEDPSPTAAARPPRCRAEASGTTRSGARRVEELPRRVPHGGTGSGRQRSMPAGRGRRRCGRRGHQEALSRAESRGPLGAGSGSVRTMARRRALSARGLAAISAGDGLRAPRKTSRCRATAPQTQGRPGGQTHPPEAAVGEDLLRQAVLAGVVADHGAHAPDREVRQARRERRVELAQLVVDLDPQRLEHPARRVALAAGRRRHGRRHHVGQLPRGGQRTGRHDRPGDAPGQPPLSVLTEECRQLVGGEAVDQVGGGGTGGRVHPHVERPVLAEREPPLGPVELGRADAQVEEHARQGPEPGIGENRLQRGERGRHRA